MLNSLHCSTENCLAFWLAQYWLAYKAIAFKKVHVHAFFISNFSSSSVINIALLKGKFQYSQLLSNCLAFYTWRFVSLNTISQQMYNKFERYLANLSVLGLSIPTLTYFSIAATRFSTPIVSDLKLKNSFKPFLKIWDPHFYQNGESVYKICAAGSQCPKYTRYPLRAWIDRARLGPLQN